MVWLCLLRVLGILPKPKIKKQRFFLCFTLLLVLKTTISKKISQALCKKYVFLEINVLLLINHRFP